MELKLNIGYPEILALIRQLPIDQIEQLKRDLNTNTPSSEPENKENSLQKLLLEGPVMDDQQYEEFLKNREYFNKWRTL